MNARAPEAEERAEGRSLGSVPWRVRAEPATILLLLTGAFLHLLRIYDRGFNLLDEGFVLHVAERVMQGQVPYRDFFTQLTPGAFFALAAVFSVTGPSVIVGRWITLLLGLTITLLLYWGARRLVTPPVALLTGPGPLRRRITSTAILVFASIPIPLALILWLAANGALPDFLRDAVWIPLRVFPTDMAAPYPPFWPPWPLPTDKPGQGEWAFRLVCLLPPLPYALTAIELAYAALFHRSATSPPLRDARAAWLVFGLAMWLTAFPRADFDHV